MDEIIDDIERLSRTEKYIRLNNIFGRLMSLGAPFRELFFKTLNFKYEHEFEARFTELYFHPEVDELEEELNGFAT